MTGHDVSWNRSNIVVAIIFVLWQFLYFGYSWAVSGRTPGMAVLGIRVVRADGTVLPPKQGVLRALVFPLSFLLFGLGFLGILVQHEHRALHDLIAGSAVVYSWDARAAHLRFLARQAELAPPALDSLVPAGDDTAARGRSLPSRDDDAGRWRWSFSDGDPGVFAVGVATLMFGFKFAGASVAAGVVATALAFGLTLLALVYIIGPVSGSHVNPAVTVGALLTGRIPLIEAVGYWVAQFAGGIVGALVLWGTFSTSPFYNRTITGLGADGYGSSQHPHRRGRRLHPRDDPDGPVRLHRLAGDLGDGQCCHGGDRHRADADRGPPRRHPGHRHVGESGPEPRPRPRRRRRGPEPSLAVHRGAPDRGVLAAGLHRLLYAEESITLAAEAQQPGDLAEQRDI